MFQTLHMAYLYHYFGHMIISKFYIILIFHLSYKNTKPDLLKMITTTEVVEIAMVESKALHS